MGRDLARGRPGHGPTGRATAPPDPSTPTGRDAACRVGPSAPRLPASLPIVEHAGGGAEHCLAGHAHTSHGLPVRPGKHRAAPWARLGPGRDPPGGGGRGRRGPAWDPPVEPPRLLPIIALLSLVTVEYGGWALLGFLTGRGELGAFREQFFRAGHAHAGVLLVLSLVYFVYLDRTDLSIGVQWLAGILLLGGILAQSGG